MIKKLELVKIANWKFKRMGKARKRIQIAKDVLVQIRSKKFNPKYDTYFDAGQTFDDQLKYNPDKQLNLVLKDFNSCDVCALGAIFLGFVDRLSHCTVSNLFNRDFGPGVFLKNYLLEYFDEEQIQMIEAAFEGKPIGCGYAVNFKNILILGDPQIERSIVFTKKIKDPKVRLVKIMKNIIKNHGTFVP